MANTVPSPNMNMPVPSVSVDPGPDWANNVNACLSILDGHNHASGSGVQINPAGLNINSDLTFLSNNATSLRSVAFTAQTTPLALGTDIGCLYVSGVDLYYNDVNGTQIRVTQSGSVTGATGTITGLPSGTASASFSASTFTFQSATNTPAIMATGPLVVGRNSINSNTVTIQPASGIASNYNFFLPTALPANLCYVTLDASGNLSTNSGQFTGSGAVVLNVSPTIGTPNFSGVPTGSIRGGQTNPVATYTHNAAGSVPLNFTNYLVIGAVVYVSGVITFVTAGAGGTALSLLSIPVATTTLLLTGNIATTDILYSGGPFLTPQIVTLTGSSNTAVKFANTGDAPGDASAGQPVTVYYSYAYLIN